MLCVIHCLDLLSPALLVVESLLDFLIASSGVHSKQWTPEPGLREPSSPAQPCPCAGSSLPPTESPRCDSPVRPLSALWGNWNWLHANLDPDCSDAEGLPETSGHGSCVR